MLSTAIYPALAPGPAAFSRAIASGELRDRLGFQGVSITDALETVAVRDFGGPAKAGVAAARAGTDLLLFTALGPAEAAGRALVAGLRSGRLDREQFEAASAARARPAFAPRPRPGADAARLMRGRLTVANGLAVGRR